MTDDPIESWGSFPVSDKELLDTMLGLAEGLCEMPICRNHLSWNMSELRPRHCRGIHEHAVAGRINYYTIDEEPGVIYVEPMPSLAKWRSEQLNRRDRAKPIVNPKRPGRKSDTKRDEAIAQEYSDGMERRLWKGQADYLMQKHPDKTKNMNRATSWLSMLLKRVREREALKQ